MLSNQQDYSFPEFFVRNNRIAELYRRLFLWFALQRTGPNANMRATDAAKEDIVRIDLLFNRR